MSIRLAPHFPRARTRLSQFQVQPPLNGLPSEISAAAFHTRARLGDEPSADPYQVLDISPSATQAEIKKQFFQLSKLHHPDRNPNNQEEASRKFAAIADAYHIVGDPTKREKFDRERQRHAGRGAATVEHRGSYAGSRPASGLSRRRGQFRGPPPSFYRNGGWGASAKKREEHASTDARAEDARRQYEQQGTSGPYGGSTGSWPFNTDPNDVPHFNREGHYKTTTTLEEQLRKGRNSRRRVEEEETFEDDSVSKVVGRFVTILGVLTLGLGAPLILFGRGVMS